MGNPEQSYRNDDHQTGQRIYIYTSTPPLPRGGEGMAAALAIFEPFLPGCIPDQAGLFGVGTSQTDPSIAYIPYIPYLA